MLNACFRAAIKVLKISWQLISDSIQHSSLFCLKMLNKAVKNGFPCKTFFKWNEEQQIHTMNEWSDRKHLILNTHTPSTGWPAMVHWLPYHRNVREKRLLISVSVRRERSQLCDSAFLLERIFKWHLLSLNDNVIQHKPTKQTEKPHKC